MLTEQEKRSFFLSTIRPMAEFTMPSLTQVVGVVEETIGKHLGTGIYCMVDGRQAVVTAAHVLRQAESSGDFQSLAFSRGSGAPPAIVAGRILLSDDVDIAIYFPSRPFPIESPKTFWPEDQIDQNAEMRSRDYLFVHGFPARFSRATPLLGSALVSETLAYGAMMRYQEKDIPASEREQFNQETPDYHFLAKDSLKPHQFALNFSVETDSFIEPGPEGLKTSMMDDWSEVFRDNSSGVGGDTLPGQKPRGAYGLSGSPVWRIGAAGRSINDWAPRLSHLVGIVTHWSPQEQVLIATSASSIYEVVHGTQPLAPVP